MKKIIKDNWVFLLIVLIGGLIGGYCVGLYMYDSLSKELLIQLKEQSITKEIYSLSTMIQYGLLYGIILALIGIIISKKINLWNKFKYDSKAFKVTMIISIISALALYPLDKLIFGRFSAWINDVYNVSPTIPKIISGLLVGGIIEEIMMRLFLMSLIILIISKLFYKNKSIPLNVYVISNIISSLLFATAHLPSTMIMTTLTPILIIRCFILNGGLGLCFGYLYRKYNIGYAMIAHGLSHLISDILMLIFI